MSKKRVSILDKVTQTASTTAPKASLFESGSVKNTHTIPDEVTQPIENVGSKKNSLLSIKKPKTAVTILLPDDLRDCLLELKKITNISVTELSTMAIEYYLLNYDEVAGLAEKKPTLNKLISNLTQE